MPPLVRFGLLALIPVVALGVVLGNLLSSDVQQRNLETARASGTLIAQVGIQPFFTAEELTNGLTVAEVAVVDQRLEGASVSTEVQRLKVWNRRGQIVYSDNHDLIGRTFPIDDDLEAALSGTSSSSVTSGHDAENAGDNLSGPLIQVYVPLVLKGSTSPSGAFELYLPYAPVQAAINHESQQLDLLLASGVALFYLSMFPVVLLALRWQRRAEAAATEHLAALERLNRLKSEFIVGIRHQFRTALVGIEGFSELIRDADHLEKDELKAFANDIHGDAERLDRAFERMLQMDQSDTGASRVSPEQIDLNVVLSDVANVTGRSGVDPQITLR